ncbi:AfsR/SARP family transcriptional regulator [Actinopolymorpha alba]|uniref:AfsR/SARP family transcriptional regulator n=1 Tax=Actinopolymorpha alba TaxID=533267 RepID=UPI00036225F2|nr:BTAD domain-containing putative transcriptional regulator [Actinopolymorpha alba]
MRELRVRLFGPFQLLHGERPVSEPMLRKAQELLALLLLSPQRGVRREVAADALWPEADPCGSRKAMRQALWQIHQATDGDAPDGPRLVLTDAATVRINPERPLWLDVEQFTAGARTAQSGDPRTLTEAALEQLAAASDVYRGPLLDGHDEDWCLVERTRLEDLHLTVLDVLTTAHEQGGRVAEAIRWAQRLLEIEPAHERSHQRLMRLYYESDDRTRALRQYERCRWVLEHELGIRPSGRTDALAAAIRSGEPSTPASPTPTPSSIRLAQQEDLSEAVPAAVGYSCPAQLLESVRAELAALRASVDAISAHVHSSGPGRLTSSP